MKENYKVGIIGAGSIAGLIDSPLSSNIASHAHAYSKNSLCTIQAICDPNELHVKKFQKQWGGCVSYKEAKKLLQQEAVDILSIASPTSLHTQHLSLALEQKSIKMILCEKPVVQSLQELTAIRDKLVKTDKKVLINLIRRYSIFYQQLPEQMQNNQLGKILTFQATINKGLLHNGIHILDVMTHLLGQIANIKPSDECIYDDGDLYGWFHLTCNKIDGRLNVIKADYSIFELTIWCENGKIVIDRGGSRVSIFKRVPSDEHEGYFILEQVLREEQVLRYYAKESLQFLLTKDLRTCKTILSEHLDLHQLIFETIEKVRRR